jgi:Ca2+-binding RTX toxin-like protein
MRGSRKISCLAAGFILAAVLVLAPAGGASNRGHRVSVTEFEAVGMNAASAQRRTIHVLGLNGTDSSNSLSLSYDEATDELVFTSEFTFAPPLPEGCTSPDPPEEMHTIRCVRGVFDALEVNFLGGPDLVEMEPGMSLPATVRAGEGADVVTTSSADDVVQGGPGNDTIATERGRDVIRGGPGRDKINDGPGKDSVRP